MTWSLGLAQLKDVASSYAGRLSHSLAAVRGDPGIGDQHGNKYHPVASHESTSIHQDLRLSPQIAPVVIQGRDGAPVPQSPFSTYDWTDVSTFSGNMQGYLGKHKIPIFVWPPFSFSRFLYGHQFIPLWFLPMMLAGIGFFLQNLQLHIGTYFYVHKMMQVDLQMAYVNTSFTNVSHVPLTIGLTPANVSFGSLHDPVTGILGAYSKVDISSLDAIAMLFPFFFVLLAVAMDQAYVWVRIMICFFFLAVGKGLFGWITIVPDSNGWKECQSRLSSTKFNVNWYAQERSWLELLCVDPRSRLCADMMYSGHTYFVMLFALGLHEVTRLAMRASPKWQRYAAEIIVASAAILQQAVEVYFVLKSRFHYASDVLMAIFVTYLVYTNSTIAVLSQWWLAPDNDRVRQDLLRMRQESVRGFRSPKWIIAFMSRGIITLGCCCCEISRQYIYNHQDIVNMMQVIEIATSTIDDRKTFPDDPESQLKMTYETIHDVTEAMHMVHRHDLKEKAASGGTGNLSRNKGSRSSRDLIRVPEGRRAGKF